MQLVENWWPIPIEELGTKAFDGDLGKRREKEERGEDRVSYSAKMAEEEEQYRGRRESISPREQPATYH